MTKANPTNAIDWDMVKSRLNKSRRSMRKALRPDARQIEAAYRKRTTILARPVTKDNDSGDGLDVLSFWLNEERYGVRLGDISELLGQTKCTRIPGAARELLGVTNLHGEIRPILDLNNILGLAETENHPSGCVIFLRNRGKNVGLRIDRMDEVKTLVEDELALADGKSALPRRFVKGISPDMLILLDVDELLALEILQDNPENAIYNSSSPVTKVRS